MRNITLFIAIYRYTVAQLIMLLQSVRATVVRKCRLSCGDAVAGGPWKKIGRPLRRCPCGRPWPPGSSCIFRPAFMNGLIMHVMSSWQVIFRIFLAVLRGSAPPAAPDGCISLIPCHGHNILWASWPLELPEWQSDMNSRACLIHCRETCRKALFSALSASRQAPAPLPAVLPGVRKVSSGSGTRN